MDSPSSSGDRAGFATGGAVVACADGETVVAEILLDAENRLVWRFVIREGPIEIDVELDRAILRETARLESASPGTNPR